MSEQLQDEIISINSIYDPDTLTAGQTSSRYILRLPSLREIAVQLDFPPYYPDAPPSILGTESTGPSIARGSGQRIVDILRDVLAEVFVIGMPCIFELIESTTTRLHDLETHQSQAQPRSETAQAGQPVDEELDTADQDKDHDIGPEPPWTVSDVVTEKKSVFVARAAAVTSVDQPKQYLRHLLVTDKKVARATHNITAWRIEGANNVQYQDCDDDGETAAGGRLLHLLELMGVWNVMVVVTRWYGGVHLGSDRFRIINQVGRDAVVKGGWVTDATKKKTKR